MAQEKDNCMETGMFNVLVENGKMEATLFFRI